MSTVAGAQKATQALGNPSPRLRRAGLEPLPLQDGGLATSIEAVFRRL